MENLSLMKYELIIQENVFRYKSSKLNVYMYFFFLHIIQLSNFSFNVTLLIYTFLTYHFHLM